MRQLLRVNVKEMKHKNAIVTALRISEKDALMDMGVMDLVSFWAWGAARGLVDNIRSVSAAIFERQYDDRCFVYFIGDPRRKVVKIGMSTDVTKRLSSIQTGYPYPLSILCVVPGDDKLEAEIQNIFSPLRTNGEWFKYDRRIKTYISTLNAEMFTRVVGE